MSVIEAVWEPEEPTTNGANEGEDQPESTE
jgi:hypothetical protein